ncbi:MAG: GSU2403 family nucleotidyltransferase fold protein [Candidatus Aminicenantales bacterium]
MEKELPRIREALRLLRSTRREDVDLTDPVLGLLRAMTQHKLWESGFEIIGSWCFLLYQKHLPMERYPLRTEDLDILVPRPFKGRSFDLSGLMQSLGFSQRFNPDGSMYFTGNRMKVEFVMKERRDGTLPPLHIKEIALTPQELRHLDLLLADPIVLKLGPGIRAKVPSPSAFLLHKLFLAARPERRDKKEKDIRQAVYVGQYALTERTEKARLLSLWSGLPKKWRALIRRSLVKAEDMMPLEAGVIKGLLDLLR